ncbi:MULTISPECIES: serine hydrolase [unclassified Nocardiopsis]|uniref:serine hydrolase n=1 Tax=unclassified Nocardiopsis TaxID=2649073 RepID=UPI001F3C6349|nr:MULTISPECIES: serine hydrolase [unclassified Nocardiopsis]
MLRRHPPSQIRVWPVAAAALALALAMVFALPGATSAARGEPPSPDPALVRALLSDEALVLVPFAPRTGPATGGATLTPDQRDEVAARLEEIGREHGAEFGIAVQDLRTGATFSHNAHQQFPTASVAKLSILTMLLLRAQEEGRELTAAEREQASVMIRYSDNDVTDGLYARIGFTEGFERGAGVLGFTGTDPNPRGVWGSTMTTAADQLRLLRVLYCDDSPLRESDRALVRELMESVAGEQAWGVSAAAAPGDAVGIKNGWVPRESNGGLWTVNSVGYVVGAEHEYLIAVLTDDSADYFGGVSLVEELVLAVTGALEGALPAEGTTR